MRAAKVRTNSIKGIVQFRNDKIREFRNVREASEILRAIPLALPGPPPQSANYDSAFRKLIYPTPFHKIVYGPVLIKELADRVELSSQETVALEKHPYPSAAGQRARILLPSLEECVSLDDILFLRKHARTKESFRIYFYSLPTLMDGILVYECDHWPLVEFRPGYKPR